MSDPERSRASELAAEKVEQIVTAAGEAAEQIRESARLEQQELRKLAEKNADEIRGEARRDAETELNQARKQAIIYGQDARREAEELVGQAKKESDQIREQTRRAVDGRVAAAEKAAAEVLEEARALSGGLHHLGRSLEAQADKILRDVQAAHKRMQADLRVSGAELGSPPDDELDLPLRQPPGRRTTSPRSAPARAAAARGGEPTSVPSPRARPNPFEELDVPSWVGREE